MRYCQRIRGSLRKSCVASSSVAWPPDSSEGERHFIRYAAFSSCKLANSRRNRSRFSSSSQWSQSSQKIHSPLARSMLSLRAAAKSSRHGKSKTFAPYCEATPFVRSVEPVSTTIVSCTRSAAEPRHLGSRCSSFLAIRQRETRWSMTRNNSRDQTWSRRCPGSSLLPAIVLERLRALLHRFLDG